MVTFGDLLHPQLIRVNGDSGDIHPAAFKMDDKQHVVGRQPTQRQHLRHEKVGPRQQRQVGPNEGLPWGRALALRRGRHTLASPTFPTVWSETSNPRLASAPTIRS